MILREKLCPDDKPSDGSAYRITRQRNYGSAFEPSKNCLHSSLTMTRGPCKSFQIQPSAQSEQALKLLPSFLILVTIRHRLLDSYR